MCVKHSFEKNETATMFFLIKPSRVFSCTLSFLNFDLISFNTMIAFLNDIKMPSDLTLTISDPFN